MGNKQLDNQQRVYLRDVRQQIACTFVLRDRAYSEFVIRELHLKMIIFSERVMLLIMRAWGC
jgi:hypothetical protein